MDEVLLATAGEDVRLWTMPDLSLHMVKNSSTTAINHCICSGNGQLLAYSNEGHDISVAFLTGQSNLTYEIPTACEQSSIDFSHNSRYIVSGGRDGVVNIWDVKSRTMRRTFHDHIHPVSCCVFNFNDKIVASSSDHGEIILTEVSSGTSSTPMVGITMDKINHIAYSHFTHYLLASADSSGSVTLWDTNSKKLLKTFSDHNSSATGLTFSPLNDMLLSSTGFDKRIIFYDVCYKKIVKTIHAAEPLTSCDFLHDGTTVAVGSVSGHVYIFDLRHGAGPVKTVLAHKTSVKSTSFQKIPKDRGSKSRSSTLSSQSSTNSSNNPATTAPPTQTDVPMEVSAAPQLRQQQQQQQQQQLQEQQSFHYQQKQHQQQHQQQHTPLEQRSQAPHQNQQSVVPSKRSSQLLPQDLDIVPVRGKENEINMRQEYQDDTMSQSSGSSINSVPTKSAKLDGFFSPLGLDSPSRKPVVRSKSALKKYDIKPKDDSAVPMDCTPSRPDLGRRSKSGFAKFSLISRSTGDLTRSSKKLRDKSDDEQSGLSNNETSTTSSQGKRHLDVDSPLENKKGILSSFKSTFRRKNNDRGTDDSETSSLESYSVDDKAFVRGKKGTRSNRSAELPDVLMTNDKADPSTNNTSGNITMSPASKHLFENAPQSKSEMPLPSQQDLADKFPVEFIQNMIEEAMEDAQYAVHKDMLNLQFEMVRQMEIQKEQIRSMLEHYAVNQEMVLEIQRLRIENDRLKRKY